MDCPESFTVQTASPQDTAAVVTWDEPTATDESGPVQTTQSHNPGQLFPNGETTVTYSFLDSSDNENTCSFVVTVVICKLTFFLS